MRSVCYSVAMSLDGFIAGPKGEYDWIIHDPAVDFGAMLRQFDTLLMGRRTFDLARSQGSLLKSMNMKIVVVSSTLNPAEHKDVTIVSSGVPQAIAALKAETGKAIWLFGGGALFRSLLDSNLVDELHVSVIPVLLGSGVPLIPEGRRCSLQLQKHKVYPSGIVWLSTPSRTMTHTQVSEARPGPPTHCFGVMKVVLTQILQHLYPSGCFQGLKG